MAFIPPLELKTIIVNIFSGDPEIFGILSILIISSMAGYFRMNMLGMLLMIGIFVLMFSEIITLNFFILFAIFGGLAIGYTISKIFQ